jgi:dynein heavy chain, axonemal
MQPPIARDLPPIAGKILWSRQLYKRIHAPMCVFGANKTILQHPDAKRIIKAYNQMSAVLVEYEVLHHRAWLTQVDLVLSGVHASLLVRHPHAETSIGTSSAAAGSSAGVVITSTGSSSSRNDDYYVNFDPEIMTLIRETECMQRLRLHVPAEAAELIVREELLKQHYDKLKYMLDENRRIRSSMPNTFEHLMAPRVQHLDQVILPGCTSITWASPNVNEYCDGVLGALAELDLVVKRANDLIVYRVDAVLNDMTNITLCELGDDEPVGVEAFVHKTEELCRVGALSLQAKSQHVEEAVEELVELLYPDYKSASIQENEPSLLYEAGTMDESGSGGGGGGGSGSSEQLEKTLSRMPPTHSSQTISKRKQRETRQAMLDAAYELFSYFHHKNLDAIVKLIRSTLERLRRRINASQSMLNVYGEQAERNSSSSSLNASMTVARKESSPVFKTYAVLAIPGIAVQPTLDEIQHSLNKAVQLILSVCKHVAQWTKDKKSLKKKQLQEAQQLQQQQQRDLGEKEISHQESSQENGVDATTAPALNQNETIVERPPTGSALTQASRSYFKPIYDNKDISKLSSLLFTCISSTKKDVLYTLEKMKSYQFMWNKDRDDDVKEFMTQQPRVGEFETKIKEFEAQIADVNAYAEYVAVGAVALYTEKLKLGLISEIGLWKSAYGQACNQKYRKEINEILLFIEDVNKRLHREIKDLDDIRLVMAALRELRDNEIRIDMCIAPIEESYGMLQKHDIEMPREEIERCDTLRYNWQRLLQMASDMSGTLLEIQPLYKDGLKDNVKDFIKECGNFYSDYRRNGPMVAGVPPREASDRLFIFQNQFDSLFRKYVTYTGGEE